MLTFTRRRGIGGAIKQSPEDFVVKEITEKGVMLEPGVKYDAKSLGEEEVPEGKQITFVLEKRDWNTLNALLTIAKLMGRGRKSIGYAGTKDKKALTVQMASVFHPDPFDMSFLKLKDISINGSWRSNGVELGSDLGNAFDIKIGDVTEPDGTAGIASDLGGKMPNYFGPQRFGERQNNQIVGMKILQGDFEGAVMEFLCSVENERNAAVTEARTKLKETLDFAAALNYFPRYLRGERTVIAYLARYPKNYANAIRLLPRGTALMFVHAVQSKMFNEELESRISTGDFKTSIYAQKDGYGFPDVEKVGAEGEFPVAALVGYETKDEEISDYMKGLMEKMQITKEMFTSKGLKELNMKGSYRSLIAPVKDLAYETSEKEVKLRFSLPKGSYATVLLDEFIVGSSGV
jgi:tRNA pseudouridine13 synthase